METFLGSPVLAFIHKWPVLSILATLLLNMLLYGGVRGGLGGYLPRKVRFGKDTFYTSRRDAYSSERLTRIIQWRFFGGGKLPKEQREKVLDEYGPSSRGCFFRHYKNVNKNEGYTKQVKEK